MEDRNPPRDYDSEIAEIVTISAQTGTYVSPILPTVLDSQQSTPIIKWVARTDEGDSRANT